MLKLFHLKSLDCQHLQTDLGPKISSEYQIYFNPNFGLKERLSTVISTIIQIMQPQEHNILLHF